MDIVDTCRDAIVYRKDQIAISNAASLRHSAGGYVHDFDDLIRKQIEFADHRLGNASRRRTHAQLTTNRSPVSRHATVT